MHTIRAITLDLDDTLWPFAPIGARIEQTLHAWFETHCAETARMFPPAAMHALREQVMEAHPALAHDMTQLRKLTIERALKDSGADVALAADAYAAFFKVRNEVTFYDGAQQALETLAKVVPICALSNGNADLDAIGIGQCFSARVGAREFGAAKPDARIFLHACALLGHAPEHVLHIGDDLAADVRGAQSAGMPVCWIHPRPVQAGMADYQFESFAEFVSAFARR
ncbi:HAD-IA family hydrolase [Lysobacter sp. HDW10]|uniref:HAD family hydrolase n=1 Tax=Lysobacter sp. HDW10 TaxID=2714936 RepID=UPI00140D026B|nr:HAD-IA family hydrolase [Lysobacter sp. HDW10]QIK80524.1 HAD-IA family hydrolase [Lysobacter sp. HDW10]